MGDKFRYHVLCVGDSMGRRKEEEKKKENEKEEEKEKEEEEEKENEEQKEIVRIGFACVDIGFSKK